MALIGFNNNDNYNDFECARVIQNASKFIDDYIGTLTEAKAIPTSKYSFKGFVISIPNGEPNKPVQQFFGFEQPDETLYSLKDFENLYIYYMQLYDKKIDFHDPIHTRMENKYLKGVDYKQVTGFTAARLNGETLVTIDDEEHIDPGLIDIIWGGVSSFYQYVTEAYNIKHRVFEDYVGQDVANKYYEILEHLNSPENDINYWLEEPTIALEDFIEDHTQKAIDNLGKTTNKLRAGYMLKDGTYIDLTYGGHNRSDHRDISVAFDDSYDTATQCMIEFMKEGNIRLIPESPGIDMIVEPTETQYKALHNYILYWLQKYDEFTVDITKENGDVAISKTFKEFFSVDDVLKFIKNYFNGILTEADIGYHYGDLGNKADRRSKFGIRNSGGFGTGTYFVGTPISQRKDGGSYKNRPEHIIDVSKYNLFRPRNNEQAYKLHDALLAINNMSADFEQAPPTWRSILDEFDEVFNAYYAPLDALDDDDYTTPVKLNTKPLEKYIRKYNTKKYYPYKLEKGDDLMEVAREITDNRIKEARAFEDILYKLSSGLGYYNDDKLRRIVIKALQDKSDVAPSTLIMKDLGYEGIDVRHLDHDAQGLSGLDNFNFGSVIYDLKEALLEDIAAVRAKYPKIPDEVFNEIIRLDPTFNPNSNSVGTYGKWILTTYNRDSLSIDDSIKEVLDKFDKIKRNIPNEYRDINKYKSQKELEDMLDEVEPEYSDRQLLRQKQKARHNADIDADLVFDGAVYQVYVPKTYEASCKLGANTKWCTATTETRSYFNSYTEEGPLYIVINKEKPKFKYQFYFEYNPYNGVEPQFMDKDDEPIDIYAFLLSTPELYEFFKTQMLYMWGAQWEDQAKDLVQFRIPGDEFANKVHALPREIWKAIIRGDARQLLINIIDGDYFHQDVFEEITENIDMDWFSQETLARFEQAGISYEKINDIISEPDLQDKLFKLILRSAVDAASQETLQDMVYETQRAIKREYKPIYDVEYLNGAVVVKIAYDELFTIVANLQYEYSDYVTSSEIANEIISNIKSLDVELNVQYNMGTFNNVLQWNLVHMND